MNLRMLMLLVLVLGLGASVQAAVPLDLTDPAGGADGFINGGYFLQVDPQSTGTGVIDPFLLIQKNGKEEGYNTDPPLQLDTKPPWTHALSLSAVPVVNLGGVDYREFLLDINESGGRGAELLSLDKLSLYIGNDPNALGTKIWDMDAAGDTWIKLDYSLNAGSGSGDMLAYIPSNLFTGGSFVNLYSQFGAQGVDADGNSLGNGLDATDGFEEWAVREPVPEPGVVLAALSILCPAGLIFRRKK